MKTYIDYNGLEWGALHYRGAIAVLPPNPVKDEVWKVDGKLFLWDGTAWVPFSANFGEGSDIKFTTSTDPDTGLEVTNINAVNKTAFTTNVAVGNLSAGSAIAANESIISILNRILVSEIDASVYSYPKFTFTLTGTQSGTKTVEGNAAGNKTDSTNFDMEIGSTFWAALTAGSYVDGYFKSYTGTNTYVTNFAAGCVEGTKVNGSEGTQVNPTRLGSTAITVTAYGEYGNSTNVPKKSSGVDSSVSITGGRITRNITFTPKYRMFTGSFDAHTSYTRSDLTAGDLVNQSVGTEIKFEGTNAVDFNKKYMVFALPGTLGSWTVEKAMSANNEDQRSLITNGQGGYSVSGYEITIADAGGTARAYTIFEFAYGIPLNVSVELIFKKS